MRLSVAVLILSAVLVLGIAVFETRVLFPAPSNGPAHGVVWAGQTFATRADFARWLRSQGTSYRAWARRHPVEAGLPTHPRGVAAHRNRKVTAGSQRHSGWGFGVVAKVAALLAALALGVALVRRRWPGSGASVAHLIGVVGLTSAAAMKAGARRTRRWAAPTAQRSTTVAAAATLRARHRTGRSAAQLLEVAAQATRRWAALTAQRSTALATGTTFSAKRRRFELFWYVTMALVAVGIGVVMAALLNGG